MSRAKIILFTQVKNNWCHLVCPTTSEPQCVKLHWCCSMSHYVYTFSRSNYIKACIQYQSSVFLLMCSVLVGRFVLLLMCWLVCLFGDRNVFLTVFKAFAYYQTGSITMLAETIHSLSDAAQQVRISLVLDFHLFLSPSPFLFLYFFVLCSLIFCLPQCLFVFSVSFSINFRLKRIDRMFEHTLV